MRPMDSSATPGSWRSREGNLGGLASGESGYGTLAALTALAVLFSIALTFATVEFPRLVNNLLAEYFPDYLPVQPEAQDALRALRPIGYACLAAVGALIVAGFLLRRKNLTSVGVLAFFLPTFGYFAGHMFFLAGLGILRAMWIPLWQQGIMRLGDVVYLPYMAVVYPFHLAGIDVRMAVAYTAVTIGFFLFLLGTIAWFRGKARNQKTVNFWIYRFSRHPQYLGFIVWSYGIMLLAAFQPVPFGGMNPGASLPWVISTLLVICIALSEEMKMSREDRIGYLAYRRTAPFLFPVPESVVRIVKAPLGLLPGKGDPANGRRLACTFGIYLLAALLLSTPFALMPWPGQDWSIWPSGRPPGTGPPPKETIPEGNEEPVPGGEEAPVPRGTTGIDECLKWGWPSAEVGR